MRLTERLDELTAKVNLPQDPVSGLKRYGQNNILLKAPAGRRSSCLSHRHHRGS